MNEGFADTANGRIHYIEQGAGQPILLTHSGGGSLHEFDENVERLAARGRVIAWDLPGHGDSDPQARHLSVRDLAATAAGLLDALGIGSAAVVGCSIGGLIAVEMGAHFADRVDKVVIVDIQLRSRQWWVDNWMMVEGMFTEVVQPFATVAPRFRALTAEQFRRWNIDRTKAGARAMMDVVWAARDYDVLATATRIRVPAMALIGASGPVVDCLDDFRRLLPEGRIEVLAECGHFPMMDDPETFDALVAEFLELNA